MDTHKAEQYSSDDASAMEMDHLHTLPKYWVAALVKMNAEKKASTMLTKLGYHTYVPTQTVIRQWSDRKKKIERVVIPLIIFLFVDKEEEAVVRRESFISKLISYPGQKEAAKIPAEQIEKLKFMLNNANTEVEFSDKAYEVGDEVEIIRGPLKGLYGELCCVEKGRPMLGIYVHLLGYSYVNVDIKDVKRRG